MATERTIICCCRFNQRMLALHASIACLPRRGGCPVNYCLHDIHGLVQAAPARVAEDMANSMGGTQASKATQLAEAGLPNKIRQS